MVISLIERMDALCPHCGHAYYPDEMLRCWECKASVCPHCATEGPQPLCPDCVAKALPQNLPPMLAIPGEMPLSPAQWGLEYKWDGIRALCYWDGRRLSLQNRHQAEITASFPELQEWAGLLPNRPFVLDGELVALNDQGQLDSAALQQRMLLQPPPGCEPVAAPIYYYAFDLLFMGDRPTMNLPYAERREMLASLDLERSCCRVPLGHVGQGQTMLETAADFGLEGVIAKRLDSLYEPGRRSPHWLKIKTTNSQAFVIGGWIPQSGKDTRVGELLIGAYDEYKRLQYAGRVEAGFTEHDRRALAQALQPWRRPTSPFRPSQATSLPSAQVIHVTPRLVARVQYGDWPAGELVQNAVYKGLGLDRIPFDIVREEQVRPYPVGGEGRVLHP